MRDERKRGFARALDFDLLAFVGGRGEVLEVLGCELGIDRYGFRVFRGAGWVNGEIGSVPHSSAECAFGCAPGLVPNGSGTSTETSLPAASSQTLKTGP